MYINEWIQEISDITTLSSDIYSLVESKSYDQARFLLPKEEVYELPKSIAERIQASMLASESKQLVIFC